MKTDKITIRIFEEVGGDAAISVNDGDAIYKKIDEAIAHNFIVILDFQNINLIITAFLNACIGQLYSKYSSEQLNQCLQLENVKDEDKVFFNKAIIRAKEYFANSEDFDKSISKVMEYECHS